MGFDGEGGPLGGGGGLAGFGLERAPIGGRVGNDMSDVGY